MKMNWEDDSTGLQTIEHNGKTYSLTAVQALLLAVTRRMRGTRQQVTDEIGWRFAQKIKNKEKR